MPRPTKEKSHTVLKSIRAKLRLIQLVLDDPKNFTENTTVHQGLKSQVSIANLTYSFEDSGNNFNSTNISLTTLKNKSLTATDDVSFENFDRMRLGAYEKLTAAIEHSDAPPTDSKSSLKNKIDDLERSLEIQRENNFHLLQALLFSKAAIQSIGSLQNDKARDKRAREAIQTLSNILSLNSYPFNQLQRLTESMEHELKVVKP
ncbi:hypothetical protein ACFW6U_16225 [Pseudomonas guariconensis]|uniref:hypothetical protein n=1 Tax=Pseudomonas guariconensis TaxID=1288410 RepID=UPI003671F337